MAAASPPDRPWFRIRRKRIVPLLSVAVATLMLSGLAQLLEPGTLSSLSFGPRAVTAAQGGLAAAFRSLEGGNGPARGEAWNCTSIASESGTGSCSSSSAVANRGASTPSWNISLGPFPDVVSGVGGMVDDFADHYVLLYDGGHTWIFINGNWTYLVETITPRAVCGFGIAYDALDQYVVLFGGSTYPQTGYGVCKRGGNTNQTWIFKAGAWTQLTPLDSPPPQAGAAMAYDPLDREVVLLDSQYSGAAPCDTWTFARGDWTNFCPTTAPGPRAYAAMKFDPGVGAIILFGGLGCPTPSCSTNALLNETWDYKSGNWTLLHPAKSPPAQLSMFSVYDGADNYLLIIFGNTPNVKVATYGAWVFANNTWSSKKATLPPVPQCVCIWDGELAYDAAARVVEFIYNGAFYTFHTGTWTRAGIVPYTIQYFGSQQTTLVTYDWADGYTLVVFGGSILGSYLGTFDRTWTFDGYKWTNVTTKVAPFGAQAMVYDAADGYVLLYSDLTASGTTRSITWGYSHGVWTNSTSTSRPSPRTAPGLIYDDTDHYVLLLGGYCGHSLCADMWNYSKGVWTNVSTQLNSSMPLREYPLLANDSAHHEVVLFGGYGAAGILKDTWTYVAGKWTAHPNTKGPYIDPTTAKFIEDVRLGSPILAANLRPNGGSGYWRFSNGAWNRLTQGGPGLSPIAAYDGRTGFLTLVTPTYGLTEQTWVWTFGVHAVYSISIRESGLPPSSNWSLQLNWFSGYLPLLGNGSAINVHLANGTYVLSAAGPAGYLPLLPNTILVVDGHNGNATVRFEPLVKVTFREYGLSAGTRWAVDLGGFTIGGTTVNLTFLVLNGSYGYQVGASAGLSPTPGSGLLKVSGTAVLRPVKFS